MKIKLVAGVLMLASLSAHAFTDAEESAICGTYVSVAIDAYRAVSRGEQPAIVKPTSVGDELIRDHIRQQVTANNGAYDLNSVGMMGGMYCTSHFDEFTRVYGLGK